jgi:thiosulfate dehydrogenase [quinone] large subunit
MAITSIPTTDHAPPTAPADAAADRSSRVRRPRHNLTVSDWLYRSRAASALWLVARVWLGYQWVNAGYQKIWGSERAAFWFGGGAGVKGFASAGVAGSASGKGGASYGWWAAVLHDFVVPNASSLAKVVAVAELLVGIGLIVGLLTGAAALGGLLLNLMYMFSGSAGVNPMYAIISVLLILAWRNAGWLGLDGLVFGPNRFRRRVRAGAGRMIPGHRTPTPAAL